MGPVRFGIDLTACWRPRVGMVTLSLELTAAIVEQLDPGEEIVVFASRERPGGMELLRGTFVLSPYRHELMNKLRWLPVVEAQSGLDAILYPYWPSPPRRRRSAPPAVVFVHDLAFRVRPREVPWQQRAYLGTLFPRSLGAAAGVLVPTDATRDDLLAHFRVPAGRVHLVPEAPAGLGDTEGPLPEGIAPGRYLLSVGTIEPRKNYPRLVTAYRRLREQLGDATPELVVVGRTGWAYGDALAQLREAPGVRLLGHASDAQLLALYRHAIALAFPSLYEGFGLPLVEAMREGTPALVGSRGALPEIAAGAALEVDAEDVGAIAAGLRRLVEDAGLRAELAGKGRRRAADFTWQRSAAAALRVLREAASA
jgi:glycosyltransferase involved in cell wall biosynthesis